MSKVPRTLGLIALGLVNGVTIGALLGLCFGWSTVGCNAPGNEAALEGARYGAILGGMVGVIGAAVVEARGMKLPRVGCLITVPAILALCMGLLVPAVEEVRRAAARAYCMNNLQRIAMALHAYQ